MRFLMAALVWPGLCFAVASLQVEAREPGEALSQALDTTLASLWLLGGVLACLLLSELLARLICNPGFFRVAFFALSGAALAFFLDFAIAWPNGGPLSLDWRMSFDAMIGRFRPMAFVILPTIVVWSIYGFMAPSARLLAKR